MRTLLAAALSGLCACTQPHPGADELRATSVTRGDGERGAHLVVVDVDDVPSSLSLALDGKTIDAASAKPFEFDRYTRIGDRLAVTERLRQRVADAFAGLDVIVHSGTVEGEHVTCAIVDAPEGTADRPSGGASPLDCDNERESDTVFVREPTGPTRSRGARGLERELDELASSCVHEIAHSFGLSHSADREDAMFPQPSEAARFVRGARPTPPPASCRAQADGRQDTYATLAETLGVANDEDAVALSIHAPSSIARSSVWRVIAEARSRAGIRRMYVMDRARVLATVVGAKLEIAARPLEHGDYTLTFVAETRTGHRARRSVSVRVEEGGVAER